MYHLIVVVKLRSPRWAFWRSGELRPALAAAVIFAVEACRIVLVAVVAAGIGCSHFAVGISRIGCSQRIPVGHTASIRHTLAGSRRTAGIGQVDMVEHQVERPEPLVGRIGRLVGIHLAVVAQHSKPVFFLKCLLGHLGRLPTSLERTF